MVVLIHSQKRAMADRFLGVFSCVNGPGRRPFLMKCRECSQEKGHSTERRRQAVLLGLADSAVAPQ